MSSALRGLTGLLLLLLLIAGAMLLTTATGDAQDAGDDEPAPPPIPITGDELRHLTYPSEWPAGGVAPLTDGAYTEPIPDSAAQIVVQFQRAAFGEIGGGPAAAVVLATTTGGTGTFYDLHLVTRDAAGAPRPVASHFLGDRIRLQGLAFDGETVRVDSTGFAPDDAACCPTLDMTYVFQLRDGELERTTATGNAQDEADEDETGPVPAVAITGDELRNLTYPSEWPAAGVAPLTDGMYSEPVAPDSAAQIVVQFQRAAFGEIGGGPAAAVVLATTTGGTGAFYDLHLVTRDAAGAPRSVASHFLGDRIRLQGLAFDGETVRVNSTGFAPDDPFCCPTRAVTQDFGLRDGRLVFLHGAGSPVWLPIVEGSSFVSWFRGPTTSRAILASAGLLDRVWVLDPSDGSWALDAREPSPAAGPPIRIEQGSRLVLVARAATTVPVLLLRAPAACPLNPGPPDPADPSMIVHGPGQGERFAGAVAVSGMARAFEGTVHVRILDAGGAVLADTFTTAEIGGPGFGAFAADIPVSVDGETEACVQIFEESVRDGLAVNVVQIGVTLSPALPDDFPAALRYPGASIVSDSRSSNDEGETFVTATLAVDAGTAAILAFYERAFATLDAPGQVFGGYTGPNDSPVVTLALQDVSYAARAVIRAGEAPGGATLVQVSINLNPPG